MGKTQSQPKCMPNFPKLLYKLSDFFPVEATDEVTACFDIVEHVLTCYADGSASGGEGEEGSDFDVEGGTEVLGGCSGGRAESILPTCRCILFFVCKHM
jgi:hypothetical protein